MRSLALLCLLAPYAAAAGPADRDVIATFSIVARDEATGDFGVAVESRFFNVGAFVPFAMADTGAIATQAMANYTYGPDGLKLLEQGLAAKDIVDKLTGADDRRDYRQLAIIDAKGNVAAWTGAKCQPWAGHRMGKNYSVQGNILAGEQVVKEMERAFLETKGMLAERLVAALEAGQAAGGDSRGQQSAALLVVRKKAIFGSDKLIDLRVDDHPQPIKELGRLLAHYQAPRLVSEAVRMFEKDRAAAIAALETAIKRYETDFGQYALARLHARNKDLPRALAALRRAFELNPRFKEKAAGENDFEELRKTKDYQALPQ